MAFQNIYGKRFRLQVEGETAKLFTVWDNLVTTWTIQKSGLVENDYYGTFGDLDELLKHLDTRFNFDTVEIEV